MEFKVSNRAPKATLEIGGITYKIMSPTLGQSDEFSQKYKDCKEDSDKITALMYAYLCTLGNIPLAKIKDIPKDMFMEIFTYVSSGEKKS